MEKDTYIAPQMEVIDIGTVQMLAASIQVGVFDDVTEDNAVMTNRRRGTWGNLWADDEKE
jgi:hypothetical protein